MVVVETDPLKSLLNSIQVAFSPLESNFHNLAKNIEHCFNGVLKNEALDFDDRRKGKVRMKIRVEMDREKCRGNDENRANFWHGIYKLQEKMSGEDSSCLDDSGERVEVGERMVGGVNLKKLNAEEGKDLPFDHLMRFL